MDGEGGEGNGTGSFLRAREIIQSELKYSVTTTFDLFFYMQYIPYIFHLLWKSVSCLNIFYAVPDEEKNNFLGKRVSFVTSGFQTNELLFHWSHMMTLQNGRKVLLN